MAHSSSLSRLLLMAALIIHSISPVHLVKSVVPHDAWTTDAEWQKYHGYSEIVDVLLRLNATYPGIVDVFPIGRSWQGRTIYCARLTNENNANAKPAALIVGYHHARELITAELALHFAMYMASAYDQNPTVTDMLDKVEIYVVVALNVDGFDVVNQNDWQRKNARPVDDDLDGLVDEDPPEDEDGDGRIEHLWDTSKRCVTQWEGLDNDGDGVNGEDMVGGVDLNRNYGYAWNVRAESGSQIEAEEDYWGEAAFSEPETRAMKDLAARHDFPFAVSLHSGSDAVLYPWGHAHKPTRDARFKQLAERMSALTNTKAEQASQLYTTSGVWDDWMYATYGTVAFTFEIYSNADAWTFQPGTGPYTYWVGGILDVFNPPSWQIHATVERWMPALLFLASEAAVT